MILITGATGFLGSALLKELNNSHQPVRAIARNLERIPEQLRLTNVEWVQGDVLDVVSLEEAMQGVERIYHCAAVVSFESRHQQNMMQINATGTANVVNAGIACGVKKLLHISSIAALGRTSRNELITEDTQWEESNQNSVYARSKYLAEREVWRGTQEGLSAVIVNPSVIIGPAENWQQGTPRMFRTVRNGLSFYPVGMNGFVSVDDVVACMIQLMNGDYANERYILSADNLTYKEFFTHATKAFGVSSPSIQLPTWITKIGWMVSTLLHKTIGIAPVLTRETARTVNGRYQYSNEKISSALNYKFKPAKEFITQTALQYKESMRQ